MSAFATHIWLLLTFRHDLRGLMPRRFETLLVVILLAALVSALRYWLAGWGLPEAIQGAAILTVLLLWFATISLRFGVAVSLVSIGVDTVVISLGIIGISGSWVSVSTDLWQLAAAAWCVRQSFRLKAART